MTPLKLLQMREIKDGVHSTGRLKSEEVGSVSGIQERDQVSALSSVILLSLLPYSLRKTFEIQFMQ